MLAMNLLEDEKEGTIMNYATGISISTSRVTGEPSYTVHANQDPEARYQMTEGVLAAMYLLREHHIGQSVSDANTLFEPTVDTVRPPETPPPGYYLG